ncbi:MAG: NUMOD4 domain-containing protein [Oenococcus sp.]|uniref:NUMOD4 domain-containing protein n=1 Tax=Oenococcus sp. TaxID=1979414 RepID=UPI0039EA187D
MTEEIWRDIKGYEGLYQVSNWGRVRSFHRKHPLIMKPSPSAKKYLLINLHKKGVSKYFQVHRLVAQVFVPNPDSKPIVNHIDENIYNNKFSNLNWVTNIENVRWGTGIKRRSKSCQKPVKQIDKNNHLIQIYPSIRQAMKSTGINECHISTVAKNRRRFAGGYRWEYMYGV